MEVWENDEKSSQVCEIDFTLTGYADLAAINADITNFRNGVQLFSSPVRMNEVLTMYDSSYNLIYYNDRTQQYVSLNDSTKNIITYLGNYLSSATPTTAEIVAARKAKFTAEMTNYFDENSTLYHYCFCLLIGASDNFAKNSYPFKLTTLANGGRWMWRQDDLDTILGIDNDGHPTKEYYIEPGDVTSNNTDLFQGASSAFWTLVGDCFQSGIATMMKNMINGLSALATAKGITASFLWSKVLAMFSYYFWEKSAKYFPIVGYDADNFWTYIDVWEKDPTTAYNNVYPLTQAHANQYEAEVQWASLRIIYLFSKYKIGGFTGSSADGCGSLSFRPASSFTFSVKPAIYLYPNGNSGGGIDISGARTAPGNATSITAPGGSDTTFYLKGLDWLNELGDLKGLVLSTGGGGSSVPFSVKSKRLKKLKVGDETAANVLFNATTLTVEGESLEEIDARNATTVQGAFNLSKCPRLRKLLLAGSGITSLTIPAGSKVNEISMPDNATTLFFNTLPVLAQSMLTMSQATKTGVTQFYATDSPNLNALQFLTAIMGLSGNSLRYVTLHMGAVTGTESDIDYMYALATQLSADATSGYGRVVYDEASKAYSPSSAAADLQGTMTVTSASALKRSKVAAINAYFNNFNLSVSEWTAAVYRYATVGTTTFIVPAGFTNLNAWVVGGGGSRGSSNGAPSGGNGGCANDFSNISISEGDVITITVGAGAAGVTGAAGVAGDASSIEINGTTYSADGGFGGVSTYGGRPTSQTNSGRGGGSSSAKGGDGRQNPFDSSDTNLYGAGGGGRAGSSCSQKYSGGETGGGPGRSDSPASLADGTFYGAGGGCMANSYVTGGGGAGYQGIVILYLS